jgi:bifunctional ADP-heptose synthase (sugar kinase/adenylyltransferase)
LREVVGRWNDEADLAARAAKLRTDLALEALLVTRSEEGMTLSPPGARRRSRAGPRGVRRVRRRRHVIATLAVALAAGASLADAVRIANEAAGVVVGKLGTAVSIRRN